MVCLVSGPVLARTNPSNAGRIQRIKKGDRAPFDGVIYDTEAHALLVARTKAFQARLKLELDFLAKRLTLKCQEQTRALQIDLQAAQKKLQLETQARQQQRTYLLGELRKSRKTAWYRQPMFVFSAGFLVSALITGLSVLVFNSVRK